MASFYGGRPGIPFVIKKDFKSYEEMIEAFSQGNAYKEVGYGEYVIINNDNEADPYRGKVYQRGYNEAVEIGSFKGPKGSQGERGTSLKFKGEYDSSTTYYNNDTQIDIVFYEGSSYIRKGAEESIGNVPSIDSEEWELFAKQGDKGEPGEGGSSSAEIAKGLEQILLTDENLDNIKPNNFTCYYAQENNTVTSGPSSSSGGFSMLAYKVSKDRRVQEYVGAHGDRKIRYCSHSLTDENTIDGNGFNWGTNGAALCKQYKYYACWYDSDYGQFNITVSNDAPITYTRLDGWHVIGNNYLYSSSKNAYSFEGVNKYAAYGGNETFYYSDTTSNRGQYGTGEDIINQDTGWSEWRTSGGEQGPEGPQGPAGQSWITSIEGNGDGTYTLIITPSPTDVTSPT